MLVNVCNAVVAAFSPQDSRGFWIPWWIPDSLSEELGFRIPIVIGIPDQSMC